MLRHQLAPHICRRGWPDGPGHILRSRFGEVIAEEGASTVSNCSSFWQLESRRNSVCSSDRQAICRGGSTDFPAQGMSVQGCVKSLLLGVRSSRKGRGQCPHSSSRIALCSRRIGPDSVCFRHLPRVSPPASSFNEADWISWVTAVLPLCGCRLVGRRMLVTEVLRTFRVRVRLPDRLRKLD